MSVPNDSVLTPPPKDDVYLNKLVDELEENLTQINTQINGTIRSNSSEENKIWTPTLKGTTTEGTYGYSAQNGTVYRQGLIVDVWGEIAWTTSTGTGNLYVELPYVVAESSGSPFVGHAMLTGSTSNHGVRAIPGTYRLEILVQGASIANVNANITNRTLRFHCRYIGKQDE